MTANGITGLCSGDIADISLTQIADKTVIVKEARNAADHDLLKREASVLVDLMKKMLAQKATKESVSYRIPQLIAQKPGANILEFFPGYLSVEDIRKLTTGVDGRTLVWMWKRLLVVLSWVHHFGYIHGAVLPPHILYWPDGKGKDKRTHSIKLIDWCYAIPRIEHKLKAWLPDYKDFYPPEVTKKYVVGPEADLYMGASTMIYLTGGDVKKKKFGSRIPSQLAKVISKCLEPSSVDRPRNIGEYFDTFEKAALGVYGPRKFHEFSLPI